MILTFLKILFSYINKLGAYSLSSFSSFLCPSSSISLPFIFLISYCSLTVLLDDSRFALVTDFPTVSPLLPTRDTAQVQPRLSQCASLRMQEYTVVSLRVTWGRTKVLDFLSEAMVREAMLLFTVPRKP